MTTMSPTLRTVRRAIACLASVALGVRSFQLYHGSAHTLTDRVFIDLSLAIPFVAGAMIWSRFLAAQLLARGAWWSMLLCTCLISVTSGEHEPIMGLVIGCNAIALLAAGGIGLENRKAFAPVAFRGTLLIALMLAMADAGAFAWFGLGNAVFDHSYSVAMVVPFMILGVIGLLRLRTWGLVVSLAANLAIATLAATGVLNLPSPLRQLFIGSAVLQMIIPLPMLVAIIRKQPPRPAAWPRARKLAPALIVCSLAALALYATYVHDGALIHVRGW
jgi:hypothetical protein